MRTHSNRADARQRRGAQVLQRHERLVCVHPAHLSVRAASSTVAHPVTRHDPQG